MAKRPLRRPALPEGARLDFFLYLQHLVLEAGDPPTVEIGARVGVSHQAVWKALTGPKAPSKHLVEWLVEYLAAPDDVATRELVAEMWRAAVAEERQAQLETGPSAPVAEVP